MTKLRAFLVLVAGEPIEPVRTRRGGYADIIRRAAGEPAAGWLDVDLGSATALPAPSTLAGVVVTGSSASVTERASWMLRAEEYLRLLVRERVPTLGICFGHQLLAQALGGEVVRNPRGREIGTVDCEIVESDPLFSSATAPLQANATHVDTIGRLPMTPRKQPAARPSTPPRAWVPGQDRIDDVPTAHVLVTHRPAVGHGKATLGTATLGKESSYLTLVLRRRSVTRSSVSHLRWRDAGSALWAGAAGAPPKA